MRQCYTYDMTLLESRSVTRTFHSRLLAAAGLTPAPEFSRQAVTKPRVYHGREKRHITSTRADEFEFTVDTLDAVDADHTLVPTPCPRPWGCGSVRGVAMRCLLYCSTSR
ncbi:hypothetical protein J6590_001002 [Homalodisca vitripennis]|nr:hypothetical protein J6590_001002 [Homalodisca vitripennis]